MPPDIQTMIVIAASLIVALIMLPLAWISRNIWHNLDLTRLFVLIGVTAMVIFLISSWPYLP